MNSEERKWLMPDSWVLVNGEPRQIALIKGDEVGFKKYGEEKLEYYHYDQIEGIPLSAALVDYALNYRYYKPRRVYAIRCVGNNIVYIFVGNSFSIFRFNYLHELQVCLLMNYRITIDFDSSGYSFTKFLKGEAAVIPLTPEEEEVIGDFFANNPSAIGGVKLSTENIRKIASSRREFFKKNIEMVLRLVAKEKARMKQKEM